MSRPLVARISVSALHHNLALARRVAAGRRAWAVVKARAYGHGLEHAIAAFADADGLALVEFDLAVRLRELGWRKPIMMLEGAFEPADVACALEHDLSLTVHDASQVSWLAEAQPRRRLAIALKFNSGMNRLGFGAAAFRAFHAQLAAMPICGSVSLMTHFANADLDDGVAPALDAFDTAVQGLAGARSLANSAAILAHPRAHGDEIRPGIMLYGSSPFAHRNARELGLRPAMALDSRLIAVQMLDAGDAVGYGSAYVARAPMRVGIVACGYADGYPRHAPTGTPVSVAGRRTCTVGRVSMDMIAVDLTAVPEAQVGSDVQLWGEEVSIDEVATAAGTIGYELMCALAPRVRVESVR